jgi:hypothetical protein
VHTTITQDATAKLMNLCFVFISRIVCAKPGDRLGGAGLSGPMLADAAVALSKLPELDTLEYVGLPSVVVCSLVHWSWIFPRRARPSPFICLCLYFAYARALDSLSGVRVVGEAEARGIAHLITTSKSLELLR